MQRKTLLAGGVVMALAMIGLGVLGMVSGDFAMVWQPVPAGLPGREVLAYLFGIAALAGGAGLFFERTRKAAAWTVLVYLLLWLVLLRLVGVALSPLSANAWLGMGENTVMFAGSLVLLTASRLPPVASPDTARADATRGTLRAARVLFAVALLGCGQGHFHYLKETAAMVPAWLPAHTAWAAATGAGFFAAAAGILLSVYPRLAATLLAFMVGSFTVLVWAPGILANPADRLQWTGFMVSLTITAGAWLIAETYRGTPQNYSATE